MGAKTGLIVGRQQFLDAPSYILYNRETPNVPLSWNGIRGYAIWPRLRADVYDFVGTNITSNKMFHNRPDWSTRLHGLDVTWAPPSFSVGKERVSSFVDLFLIAFRVGGTAAALPYKKTTLNGTTARQDYGFRWYGGAPSFEFSVGGLYQGGSFELNSTGRNRSVSAYAFNAIAGYRQTTSPLHPFLGLQADLYSGGSSQRNQGTVGTYIAPFNPQTNYLETTTYVAPSNLVSFSPVIRITPRNWLSSNSKAPSCGAPRPMTQFTALPALMPSLHSGEADRDRPAGIADHAAQPPSDLDAIRRPLHRFGRFAGGRWQEWQLLPVQLRLPFLGASS